MVVVLVVSGSWLFIVCWTGDKVTLDFESIEDATYQSMWYLLPLKMQKCIPIIMNFAQKQVHIANFGEIHCTRETFKKVCFHYITFNCSNLKHS